MLQVEFLDIGQGDSTFITFPNGTTMLIDCKIDGDGFLLQLDEKLPDGDNKKVLDYLVITHPHNDHFKGIGKIKERYQINNIWESGHRLYVPEDKKAKYTDYYDMLNLIQKVKSAGGTHQKLTAYNDLTIDDEPDVNFLVLSPTRAYLELEQPTKRHIHDQCLVLKLTYGRRSIIFTGDSSMEAWKERIVPYYSDESLRPNLLGSTILHASHHCSYTFFKPEGKKDEESYLTGLEKIQPEITIISVGEQNNHGHPDEDSLKLYKENTFQEQVYMTKDHKTIFVYIFENDDYLVETENMKKLAKRATIGKASIQVSPSPKENGKYDINVPLVFQMKFSKLPKDQGTLKFKWTVQNNGIGDSDHGKHHEFYIGVEGNSSKYTNTTAYIGEHKLLCEVYNQRGTLIATSMIHIMVE